MARKVLTEIKLQVPAGAANPAPPVGPALGQHGVNIMEFCKAFNAQTQDQGGTIIPVVITVYEDRSFTFITKTPPAAILIKEALNAAEGLGRAEPQQGRQAHARPGERDRRAQAPRPERPHGRAGRQDHRGHRPLDGSGGRPDGQARQDVTGGTREGRPRARVHARRGDRAAQGDQVAPSSTRPSRCTSAPA